MRKTAKRATTPKNIASAGRTQRRGGDINAYQLLGYILLSFQVGLLALEQVRRHAFGDLRIRLRQ